jgi:glycerol-1-phosphate dehydrogenase [NAD(P)+]
VAVMAGAARRLRLAGVGDLLSNLTACLDWRLAAREEKGVVNGMAESFALGGARQVIGADAPDIDDMRFAELTVQGLMLSGVAMEVCGTSRPCSGGEHLISHQIDRTGEGHGLHGEQVGVATLFCQALHGEPPSVRAFAEAVGMLTTPEGFGVGRQQFLEAVRQAPATRPGRWTLLSRMLQDDDALEAAYDTAFGD